MKLSLSNRAWATSTVCRSLWGIRPPTANALSQALDELVATMFDQPPRTEVSCLEISDADGFHRYLVAMMEVDPGNTGAVRVVRAPQGVGLLVSHAILDGAMSSVFLVQLLQRALDDPVTGRLESTQLRTRHFVSAGLGHWLRNPLGLLSSVKAVTADLQARLRSRGTTGPVAGGPPRTVVFPVDIVPETLDTLIAWRAAHTPEATVTTVLLAAMARTLRRSGLLPEGARCEIAVGLRRNFPALAYRWGTAVAMCPFVLRGDGPTPAQYTERLRAFVSTGEGLFRVLLRVATDVVGTVLAGFRGGHYNAGQAALPAGHPTLAWSDLGRFDPYKAISADCPDRTGHIALTVTNARPGHLAFTVHRSEEGLHLTCFSDGSTSDPARFEAVVREVAADPLVYVPRDF